MELQDYITVVRRYFAVIFAATLIGAIAGATLTFALSQQAPVYTSSLQGVLLTDPAAKTLQNKIERSENYAATTTALIQIPSPDSSISDIEYTKSRLPFYSKILLSEKSLQSISDKLEVSTPTDSTLVSISVSNPDSALAKQFSESVATELTERITAMESPRSRVELLGTELAGPSNTPVNTLVSQLILSDPLAVSPQPNDAIAQLGEDEFELIRQELPLPRTTDQVRASLSLTTGLPATSTQVEPATPEQLATITLKATDSDPAVADSTVAVAMSVLQDKLLTDIGVSGLEISPLVLTGGTSSAENLAMQPSTTPSNRLGVNSILGLLIGAAIGLGYAFFRASRDTTVRNVRQLIELTGELPIGVIASDPQVDSNPCMVMVNNASPVAENYRALRANLMFGLPDSKVVCLTPAASGSSAITGVNLAVALSQAGQSVILVEADLHDPQIAETLTLNGSHGLNSVLAGTSTVQEATQSWPSGGISVISTKHASSNTSEMLSTEAFTQLVSELCSHYSYVLITTPPILNSTDAAIVARRCDATIVITDCDRSTTDELEIALTSLLQVRAPIGGILIKNVPTNAVNSWRSAYVGKTQTLSSD